MTISGKSTNLVFRTNQIHEFYQLIQKYRGQKTILGIDHGSRSIGVSVSDKNWLVATPLDPIDATSNKFIQLQDRSYPPYFSHLKHTIDFHQVCAIVVGYPLLLTGQAANQCHVVTKFVETYRYWSKQMEGQDAESSDPKHFMLWDERFSSSSARKFLGPSIVQKQWRSDRVKRQREAKQAVDTFASMFILEDCLANLDRIKNLSASSQGSPE
mmetsp:Transcript_10650/g.18260  ORF Transcript_10650/g.18260 Transcript_10650/m.18260 type:complete len:213 (-) Transcript_10650:33-671(-)